MARKVVNRKELRAQADAAEAAEKAAPKKAAKKAAPKAKAAAKAPKEAKAKPAKAVKKPAARKKTVKEVRMRAFWGVFTSAMKKVAMFDYADRKAADKKATELSASSRAPHFVQLVKEPISE
jgi:hypothetical protein